jgi:hypothetical protein
MEEGSHGGGVTWNHGGGIMEECLGGSWGVNYG